MRQKRVRLAAAVAVVAIASVVATTAFAGGGREIREELTGYEEDPMVVSTEGEGKFKARVRGDEIRYELSYEDLEGAVTQAHIHFGGRHQSGGITAWLCGTQPATPGPAGTPVCGPSPGEVEGVITAEDVVGPVGQGIEPGAFDELLDAIRAGVTYANVHSSKWPGGEIRGQLNDDRDDD
jgi:CHRD domain